MDVLRSKSIEALINQELLSLEEVRDWINYGDLLLEKYRQQETTPDLKLNELNLRAQYSAETMLETGLVTEGEIVGYYGSSQSIHDGDFTDKFLSISRCMGVASNFGIIYKVTIPIGVPAFYISAEAIVRNIDEEESELEILLPQGQWKLGTNYEEECSCGMIIKGIPCCDGPTRVIEAYYTLI